MKTKSELARRVPSYGDLGSRGGTDKVMALALSSHGAVCEKAGLVIRLFVCTDQAVNEKSEMLKVEN